MSKEQLKEIQDKYDMWADDYNLTPQEVEWLIEQAERVLELERANRQLEKQAPGIELDLLNKELTDALKQNKRYQKKLERCRKAMRFYDDYGV